MSNRRVVTTGAVAALILVLVVSGVLLFKRSNRTSTIILAGNGPAARGIAGITASQLAGRGIYLGPPGVIPSGVPLSSVSAPPLTSGGSPVGPSASGPEQLAVQGDPANGSVMIDASAATTTALKGLGGFVGPVTTGVATLVQLDNIYTSIVATAWVVPVKGTVDLGRGPAPTVGTATTIGATKTTALVFVDAVTGKFISEEGFSG